MQGFVQDELQKLKDSQEMLQAKASAFEKSQAEVNDQTSKSRDDVNSVLEEIKLLREDVKNKVGAGLEDLSAAAEKISVGILTEIDAFHAQLHTSYASLGRDFKTTFDDLIRQMNEQQVEAEDLRQQMSQANEELAKRSATSNARLAAFVEAEREQHWPRHLHERRGCPDRRQQLRSAHHQLQRCSRQRHVSRGLPRLHRLGD